MQIKNKKLILNKTDLDHVLDIDIFEGDRNIPPSELFLQGLEKEIEMNGLKGEIFNEIVIKHTW